MTSKTHKSKSTVVLTACIIAKNNQNDITDCIESLKFADEILLVDTGSSDMTPEIAKRLGARVIRYNKGSYDAWRTKGLREAKGAWILYMDTDERVSADLQREIMSTIITSQDTYGGYAIPRKNIIFGKEFRYGGQRPDYQKRLFLKAKLKKWTGTVHEEPVFDGELGHLRNSITHFKHSNINEMMIKTNRWSEIEAKLMYDAKHPPMNIARFASAVVREFWDKMVKKEGFRDGPEGIIYSLYQVFSKFVSYAKLWEMQEKAKLKKL